MTYVSPAARARLLLALLLFGSLLPLAACGKKGEPSPPPGATITYPRAYPHE